MCVCLAFVARQLNVGCVVCIGQTRFAKPGLSPRSLFYDFNAATSAAVENLYGLAVFAGREFHVVAGKQRIAEGRSALPRNGSKQESRLDRTQCRCMLENAGRKFLDGRFEERLFAFSFTLPKWLQ